MSASDPSESSSGGWTSSDDGRSVSGSDYDSDEWEIDVVDQPLIPPALSPAAPTPLSAAAAKPAAPEAAASANLADSVVARGKKRKRSRRASASAIRRRKYAQQAQLVASIARLVRENEACNTAWLRAAVLSLLPADKLMTLSRTEPDAFSMSALASLLSWFAANFTSPQRSADARQTMHESVDLTEHPASSVSSSSNCTAFSDVAEARGSDLGDRLASAIARAALETRTKSPSAPTLLSKRSLICVFVALARGAGLPCRIVHAPEPVLWRGSESQRKRPRRIPPQQKVSSKTRRAKTQASNSTASSTSNITVNTTTTTTSTTTNGKSSRGGQEKSRKRPRKKRRKSAPNERRSSEPSLTFAWAEAYVQGRWVHVNVVDRVLDKPESVERLRDRKRPLVYAIAIEADGTMTDVMPRYCQRPANADKFRIPVADQKYNTWLETHLSMFSSIAVGKQTPLSITQSPGTGAGSAILVGGGTNGGGGSASSPIRERRCYEAAELQLLRRREPMPTNEASFVNHPLYCLKKHLRRNQVIIGEQSCGLFKGQPVYSRALVEEAMSAVQWKKLCRTVKEDQLCSPAKTVSKLGGKRGNGMGARGSALSSSSLSVAASASSSSSGISSGGAMAAEEQVRLYGKWQTEVWTPPPVSAEGRVPRNEFGNWEVWSPAHVPRGAVHLQLPNVRKAAAHLGVDYVRAVCGFKRERGNVVPAFIGILVAKEMADAVVSTYNNLCALQQHKDAKAKSRRACLRWAKFVRMLRTRARVNQLFDGNHGL